MKKGILSLSIGLIFIFYIIAYYGFSMEIKIFEIAGILIMPFILFVFWPWIGLTLSFLGLSLAYLTFRDGFRWVGALAFVTNVMLLSFTIWYVNHNSVVCTYIECRHKVGWPL